MLNPQPSEDPNDPLNWSSLEKHTILFVLSFGCIVTAAVVVSVPSSTEVLLADPFLLSLKGPLLNAGTVEIAQDLNVSVPAVARMNGYTLLAAGASGPFASALSRKYGKRPVYLFSSLMALVGCIIGQVANDYDTLVAARTIQGLSCAAYESIVIASIGDLFFVHERSPRVGLIMLILTAINNGVSIIAGPITAQLGWSYNFHILLPFTALQLILLFFFCPETTYNRSTLYNTDFAASDDGLDALGALEEKHRRKDQAHASDGLQPVDKEDKLHLEKVPTKGISVPGSRQTFVQRLALYSKTLTTEPIWKMLIACPVIMLNVGAAYSIFASGLIVTWSVALSVISSILWSAPPYSLTAAGVGYVSVGPLIGGCLGALVYGWVSDPLIKRMSVRNGGVYEPEMKLIVMLLGLAPCVAGLVGFGYANANQVSIYIISLTWGIALFGLTILVSVPTAYALDAFRAHSTEIFVMNMTFKNFFFYGLTDYIVDWYTTQGVVNMFGVMAGITAAVVVIAVPLYVLGKRYRLFWQHHNLLEKLGLATKPE